MENDESGRDLLGSAPAQDLPVAEEGLRRLNGPETILAHARTKPQQGTVPGLRLGDEVSFMYLRQRAAGAERGAGAEGISTMRAVQITDPLHLRLGPQLGVRGGRGAERDEARIQRLQRLRPLPP